MSSENKVTKNNKNKKTRNRTPLSCSVCRSRKVKCDKNKPHCNSCVNTGYKHLCQYLSPEWSKDEYSHMFQEKEITDLKDKVKYLESLLAGYQNNDQSNKVHIKNEEHAYTSPLSMNFRHDHSSKYYNDEIVVSKRFESLHINAKTNSFTYLGSTHYLSILKGDPYLKLLWEHVFKIRDKLAEYQVYQRNASLKKMKKSSKSSIGQHEMMKDANVKKCPVNHNDMRVDTTSKSKCPVSHTEMGAGSIPKGKCPVAHSAKADSIPKGKCPVAHNEMGANTIAEGKCPVAHNEKPTNTKLEGKCPVNHESFNQRRSTSPLHKERSSDANRKSQNECLKDLQNSLPDPYTIKQNLDLFFSETYPEIPLLEKKVFYTEILNILGIQNFIESSKDDYKLTLDNLFKSSQIGILLIILRLGYVNNSQDMNIDLKLGLDDSFVKEHLEFHLSSDNNQTSPHTSFNNKPLEHSNKSKFDIDPKYIHFIYDRFINNSKHLETSSTDGYYGNGIVFTNLSVIHFLIFYKWYLGICPENDTIDTLTNVNSRDKRSELLLAEVVQLAFDSGLHRDPDNFPNLTTNILNKSSQFMNNEDKDLKIAAKTINQSIQIFKNQWRKTWFYLVSMDINQCLTNGTPRLLRKLGSFADVSLPYNNGLVEKGDGIMTDNFTDTETIKNSSEDFEGKKNSMEYLLANQQVDYCFGNNLGEIIIGKNTKLFYQIDLVIVAISELVLNSQPGFKAKKWQMDFVVDILEKIIENKSNEDVIKKCISLLLEKNLLDPLEAYAIKEYGVENITPDMCKTDSQKQRFSEDTGYNLPSLKEIFSTVDDKRRSGSMSNSNSPDSIDHGKKLNIPQENTTKCLFFKKHLQLQMMLYNVNYILFTSYEPRIQNKNADEELMDLAVYYCQQSLKYSTEIFKTSLIFFHNLNANKIFKTQMKIVLIPYCLDVCYRSMQFMICLILRQKVGSLLKDLNNVFSKKINGMQNTSSDSDSDNDSFSKSFKKMNRIEFNKMIFENQNLSLQEPYIADLLISRMDIFHNLTRILAVKYKYSLKLSRSTGFFLTLLRPNNSSSKKLLKHNAINSKPSVCPVSNNGSFSPLTQSFRNIPSLIIQANSDQLSRCPVYQDVGFQTKLPSLTSLTMPMNGGIGSIREPSISSFNYQPITSKLNGNISSVRVKEEQNSIFNEIPNSRSNSLLPIKEAPMIVKKNLLDSKILPPPSNKTTPRSSTTLPNETASGSSADHILDFDEFLKQVDLSPSGNSLGNNNILPLFDNTPDAIDTECMNSLISADNIIQASLNFLIPSEDPTKFDNDDVLVKRENSNQSVWDFNEDLIN